VIPDEGAGDVCVEAGHASGFDARLCEAHAEMRGAGDWADALLRGRDGGTRGNLEPHARAVLRLRAAKRARRMNEDRGRAAGARGLREAPRGDEIELPRRGAEIGDDDRRRRAAQRLFDGPQQVCAALRAHEHETRGVEPVRGDSRPVGRAVFAG